MTSSPAVTWSMDADAVATIRIDRPQVRNALDARAWQQLADAVAAVSQAQARAVVLTGGDRFFSAGGDVRSLPGPSAGLTAPASRLERSHRIIRDIISMQAPVLAAVEGYAIGAAWGLVLACDLVVASTDAFFQAPFALRGLVADAATAFVLPRSIGRQRAMRYLLLAERLPAPEAAQLGLVSHLVDAGQATAEAHRLGRQLASGPYETNALSKSLATRSGLPDLTNFLETERIAVALAGHGQEAAEGQRAFTERRAPNFP